MSTARIFFIFGVCVAVITTPLIIFYRWFPLILGRYEGLVENIIVGVIGAYVVALSLDFTLRRRQEKASEKVAMVALTELSQTINNMLTLFGSIFKASTDGFIPSTIDGLFDAKAAKLLSLNLSIDSRAPVASETIWQIHITRESHSILEHLNGIQNRYQAFLPENVLVSLSKLRSNPIINIFSQLSNGITLDKKEGILRPVINFTPLETLNYQMGEILSSVKTIEQASIKLGASITPHFPDTIFRNDFAPKIGSARFEGEPGVSFIIGPLPVQD